MYIFAAILCTCSYTFHHLMTIRVVEALHQQKSPISFSLKIINPNNTGGEEIIKDLEMLRYTSAEALKTQLSEKFAEGYETQFGYITPGHGMKGKQEKVTTEEEEAYPSLVKVYTQFKRREQVLTLMSPSLNAMLHL